MQAIGLYDHYIDVQGGLFMESEQYAQHAVQGLIWNFFGECMVFLVWYNSLTATYHIQVALTSPGSRRAS